MATKNFPTLCCLTIILVSADAQSFSKDVVVPSNRNQTSEIHPLAWHHLGQTPTNQIDYYYDDSGPTTWDGAVARCRNHPLQLRIAEMHQREETDGVVAALRRLSLPQPRGFWTGGRSSRSPKGYFWRNNEAPLILENLGNWEENGSGVVDYCVLLAVYPERFYYVANICSEQYYVICRNK